MSECKHGLLVTTCAFCKQPPAVNPRVLEGPTVPSRFDGKCAGCGDPIFKGEDVHLTDGGWVCTSCAREAVAS